jgi:hypothetical protein
MYAFEYIRKYKNKHVKRNRPVMYDGELMRISRTSGDGLVLRSQTICHARDKFLTIVPDENYLKSIEMMETAIEALISNGEDLWNDVYEDEALDPDEITKHMRRFVSGLKRKVKHLEVK